MLKSCKVVELLADELLVLAIALHHTLNKRMVVIED